MASKTTTIVPVRVENELVARLDALVASSEGSNRTALARDALRRGVELLEAERKGCSLPELPTPARRERSAARATAASKPTKTEADSGLEKFAFDVLAAARHSRSGWVSHERLFIVHAWRAYKRSQPARPPALSVFKSLLLEASRKRLLSLAADDMIPFHKAPDVEASAIETGDGALHLLCVARSAESWRKVR